MAVWSTVVLGLTVLVGSAIPFVPTGEVVSASAALAAGSPWHLVAILGAVLVASVLGDSAMLLAAGLAARVVSPRQRAWLSARRIAPAVVRARSRITDRAASAVVTGRLVPGGRAPVIIALGLSRYPLSRFVLADALACALWSSTYTALGAAGGRVSGHPLLGTLVAVAFAVCLGLLISRLTERRARRASRAPVVPAPAPAAPAPAPRDSEESVHRV